MAADIHLGPHAPDTAAAFYAFLEQAAQETDALILCGDIFEAWIGDDIIQRPPAWLETVIDTLRAFAQTTPLFLMRGNRDFLLCHQLSTLVLAHCLPGELIISIPQHDFVLGYGD